MKHDVISYQTHAKALCHQAGLNIEWVNMDIGRYGERKFMEAPFSTVRDTIRVPAPHPDWTQQEMEYWWWGLYHEIGHHAPETRDCFDWQEGKLDGEKKNMMSPLGQCVNFIDDYRQEKNNYDLYAGRKKALWKGRLNFGNYVMDKDLMNVDTLVARNGGEVTPENVRPLVALGAWDVHERSKWMTPLSGLAAQMERALDPETRKLYDILRTKYDGRMDACKTVQDEEQLALEVLNDIFDIPPEQAKEQAKMPQSGEGEGEKCNAGEGEGDKQKGEAAQYGEGEAEEEGKASAPVIPWSELMLDQKHDENKDTTSWEPLVIDYSTKKQDYDYIPYNLDEIDIVDYSKNLATDNNSLYKKMKAVYSVTGNLSRKVERLIQIYSRDRYKYGQKKGRLHNKNLYRATMDEAPGFNQRVFKRKFNNDCLDVSVSVLGDCSGSMGGEKMVNMGVSMAMLGKVLGDIGVNHELAGFTDEPRLVHNMYKAFGSRKMHPDKIIRAVAASGRRMRQNADGDSIALAASRLSQQKTKRKLLIVLSDGQPAGGNIGDIDAYTKKVVKEIEKGKELEIYAIGIMSNSVKRIYSEHQVISKPSELEVALLQLIKRKIIGE